MDKHDKDKHDKWMDKIRKEVPEIYDYEIIDFSMYFYMQVEEKVRVGWSIPLYVDNPNIVILILKDVLEKAKKREIPVVDYNPCDGGFDIKMSTSKPTITELLDKIKELAEEESAQKHVYGEDYNVFISNALQSLSNATDTMPDVPKEHMSFAFALISIAYSLAAIAEITKEN